MNFIFGSAGFAKEVDWLLYDIYKYRGENYKTDYFVDKNEHLSSLTLNNATIISESNFFTNYSDKLLDCFIAVGNPLLKKIIYEKLNGISGINFPSIIHPSVNYDDRENKILIGKGVIICSKNILTTDIKIEDFVHINLDCTIGHDSVIGRFTTISPGVHISGNVNIGQNVFVGTGAVILEKITICDDVIIGAGAVVTTSISEHGTYVGVPAKKIR